jgi:hypothetical protein
MKSDEVSIEVYGRPSLPTQRNLLAVVFRQRWMMLIVFALMVLAQLFPACGFRKMKLR